jgi:hypothetical protein
MLRLDMLMEISLVARSPRRMAPAYRPGQRDR